jgi:endogenous inhibitor of DNA gyrase (YacG/DUF329 family)
MHGPVNPNAADLVICEHCGTVVRRARLAQRYCSTSCRKADLKRRGRLQRSVPEASPATTLPEKRPPGLQTASSAPVGVLEKEISPPVGLWDGPPLQGDDYPLEYYDDGYPLLPACLEKAAPP